MNQREQPTDRTTVDPYRVRLPGFLAEEEVGLGDVIKRATTAVGIRPCGSCAQRAARLNQWLTFTGRRRQQ